MASASASSGDGHEALVLVAHRFGWLGLTSLGPPSAQLARLRGEAWRASLIDDAAFSSLVRAGYTRRFVPFQGRILHGSDYPVPPMTIGFLRELGPAGIRQLMAIANPFDRDALIKQALGFDRDHFEVAHQLLGSRIAHWDDWRANHLAGTT